MYFDLYVWQFCWRRYWEFNQMFRFIFFYELKMQILSRTAFTIRYKIYDFVLSYFVWSFFQFLFRNITCMQTACSYNIYLSNYCCYYYYKRKDAINVLSICYSQCFFWCSEFEHQTLHIYYYALSLLTELSSWKLFSLCLIVYKMIY